MKCYSFHIQQTEFCNKVLALLALYARCEAAPWAMAHDHERPNNLCFDLTLPDHIELAGPVRQLRQLHLAHTCMQLQLQPCVQAQLHCDKLYL